MEWVMILTLSLNSLWVTYLWIDTKQQKKELRKTLKEVSWKLEMLERRVDVSVHELEEKMT